VSERSNYPPGVPCWVETLQPDPRAALDFYSGLFGWDISGPGPMPGGEQAYYVARTADRDVAGIGALPQNVPAPTWNTHVRVSDAAATADRAKRAGGSVLVESFDVLPAGRMAVLADPSGAAFCVWEARTREGAQRVNEPNAWAMSMLHTDDIAGAIAFYRDVFGWEPDAFDAGGVTVTMCRLPGYVGGEPEQPVPRDVVAVMAPLAADAPDVPPHWSVDFWIGDTNAAVARATQLGGHVVVPPYDSSMFRQAVLADTAGATFSITQLLRA
jgi:predicted enzyme related to lactoylglutathione lyase